MNIYDINCTATEECIPYNAYCDTTLADWGLGPAICACHFELGHVMNTYAEPVIIGGFSFTGVCEDPSSKFTQMFLKR